MLSRRFVTPARQGGVVLLIALIILVALSLGGVALLRSVDTTNIIAGNLAFQQATTLSGEGGAQDAAAAIRAASTEALEQDNAGWAYTASSTAADDPADAAGWDAYWLATIDPEPISTPVEDKTCSERVCTLPTDSATGNTVSYTIQRLCAETGPFETAKCIPSPQMFPKLGSCFTPGCTQFPGKTQVYYRITTRIAGPRNTVSYIQTIVAI